jgi:hypothetical protein
MFRETINEHEGGVQEVNITLDRYSHALPTLQAEALGRLNVILGRT